MGKEINLDFEVKIESNSLVVGSYEKTYSMVKKICNEISVDKINSKEDLKVAKETRADLNKCIKNIDRVRIDAIECYTREFADKCNVLKSLFDSKQKELANVIKEYEDSLKENVADKPKVITATLKYFDEKINKKVIDFCEKNNIELTIK